MLTKKDRKILNQKSIIHNRDILISDMEKQAEVLNEENKELRFELEEKNILINKLEKIVDSNKYSNEKVFIEKIKELVHDYQSLN